MIYKIVFAFAFLMVLVDSHPRTTPQGLVTVVNLEEPCVRQGGICLRIDDCPKDNLVTLKNVLCPKQSHLGIECCYN